MSVTTDLESILEMVKGEVKDWGYICSVYLKPWVQCPAPSPKGQEGVFIIKALDIWNKVIEQIYSHSDLIYCISEWDSQ
jgi:hypothetical protein